MYKLHYATKFLNGDIPCIWFSDFDGLTDYLFKIFNQDDKKTVYLFAYDTPKEGAETNNQYGDIFISSMYQSVFDFTINHYRNLVEYSEFFLQEYESYEGAYEVALMMKEISPLCYEPDKSKLN